MTRRSEEQTPPPDKTAYTRTLGIDVNVVKIPKAGKYTVWDFAGHPEYYVTHSMFMRPENAVFLMMFKIADTVDGVLKNPMDILEQARNEVSNEGYLVSTCVSMFTVFYRIKSVLKCKMSSISTKQLLLCLTGLPMPQ